MKTNKVSRRRKGAIFGKPLPLQVPAASRWMPALAVGAVFALLALASHLMFLPQLFGGASAGFFYDGGDASAQFIPAISLLESAILDGDLFWSWHYGVGGDLFAQFSYYYTTSPFFWLQFLIKWMMGVAGGDFSTVATWHLIFSMVKQVLCMTFMYLLARQEGKARLFGVVSAIVYGCSFWYIDNSFAFDFMTDAMLWPPLLVMAFNRWERCGSWMPLVAVLALGIASNFYFGYILCAFCIMFAIVFGYRGREGSARQTIVRYAKRLGVLALIAVAALGLSCIAFIPSVAAFLSADRGQVNLSTDILPTWDFIKILPEILFAKGTAFSANEQQTYAFPLFIAIAPLACTAAMPLKSRKKSVFALALIALWTLPIISSAMNGFSYPTNRWCYLVVFAVAYAVPDWLECLVGIKRLSPWAVAIAVAIAAVCFATYGIRTQDSAATTGYAFADLGVSDAVYFLLQTIFVVAVVAYARCDKESDCKHGVAFQMLVLLPFAAAVLIAMPYGPYAAYSSFRHTTGLTEFSDAGAMNESFTGGTSTAENYHVLDAENEEGVFFRTSDEDMHHEQDYRRYENRSWILGTYPVSAYNSLISKDISRWIKRERLITSTTRSASHYRGFGHRLFVENAWGVGAKINATDATGLYGYGLSDDGKGIWKNDYATGIDMWFAEAMPRSQEQALSAAQGDAALLQAAAVDDGVFESLGLPVASLDDTVTDIALDGGAVELSGCSYADGILEVEDGGGLVSISLPEGLGVGEALLSFTAKEMNGSSFTMLVNGDEYWQGSSTHRWAYPIDDYALCFPEPDGRIEVGISGGMYEISNVALEFSSYKHLGQWTAGVNLYNLEDLVVDGPYVSGRIDNDEAGILALAMPFEKGWTCYVDGQRAEGIEVNGIFAGVYLEPGEHVVEWRYGNPYLPIGVGVTMSTIVVIVVYGLLRVRRKNKFFLANSRGGESLDGR